MSADWIQGIQATIVSYRRMIDATTEQLTDEEFFKRPAPEFNSVANLLRHLGGNLQSRWTDFLTTDGEKLDRNRDLEFADWKGDRQSLLEYFDRGWQALENATAEIDESNACATISIRGESHTVVQALLRSVTHITYHVGQISLVARLIHQGEWNWLTVPPGASSEFNQANWGRASSRAIFSEKDENG